MSLWDHELAEPNAIVSLHHFALSAHCSDARGLHLSGVGGSAILGRFLSSNNLTSNLQEITRWRTDHCFPTAHLWQLLGHQCIAMVGVGGKPQTFHIRYQIWWGRQYCRQLAFDKYGDSYGVRTLVLGRSWGCRFGWQRLCYPWPTNPPYVHPDARHHRSELAWNTSDMWSQIPM